MLKKKICCLLLAFVLLFTVAANAMDVNSQGAIVINSETGEIYFEKNAYAKMTPASLTKIMTLYIIFEKIAAGEITEDTLIPVSNNAAKLSRTPGATNVPLTAGVSVPLHTLIDSIAVVSACSSCTVIAEYFSGSETYFAAYMTQRARELGIDACFYDASGLSDNNTISPIGIAALVKMLIVNYPDVLKYTSKTSVTINGKTYKSTNLLLEAASSQYSYPGVDGFKTGTTTKAGKCLAATAVKNGVRVISVVMNASTNHYRYEDSQKLLDKAFSEAEYINRNLFSTDIRAYINNTEIPCTYKYTGTSGIMVLTEDLETYGFDMIYDEATNILYITENAMEEVVPIAEEKIQTVIPQRQITPTETKVCLVKDTITTELANIVLTDRGMAISLDELGMFYEKTWDNDTRAVHLNINR